VSAADREMIASLQRESAEYANRLDEWRARAGEAIRLLHMLDRPDARHPDVAAFLDALDDNPAPAWLDAPDGEGHWWVRDPLGRDFVCRVWRDDLGALLVGTMRVEDEAGQWQRVAPPREDV